MHNGNNCIMEAARKYWPEYYKCEYKDVALFTKKAKSILLDHMNKRGAMRWEINAVINQYEFIHRSYDAIINDKQFGV